jgi:hypothetical protein
MLTLSATEAAPPYVIDPRFPLFQQPLEEPKKSHEALAQLLGAPELVRSRPPGPADFGGEMLSKVARRWVEFNTGYGTQQAAKFDKYAQRLEEEVVPADARGPEAILAPYFVCSSTADPWWQRSEELFDAARAYATRIPVLRVVACVEPDQLDDLLTAISDERVVVWISGLHELELPPEELAQYGLALRAARARDQSCFALYGGFFSVLLASSGLDGASHGIGYGEHRTWLELPRSGPPPARFYLPRVHRYIGQDLAYQLWSRNPELTHCACAVCNGGPPVLKYHELMKHSVLVRQREIDDWGGLAPRAAAERLRHERVAFLEDLRAARLPMPVRTAAARTHAHLDGWAEALELIGD